MNAADRIAAGLAELEAAAKDLQAQLKADRSRARAGRVRELHDLRRRLAPDRYRYVSQAGQDAVVDQVFGSKRGGTFVDVGGYDGVTGSNTFFFEQFRQWTGVLVEPVPSQLAAAQQVRRCTCLGLAIAADDGEADFIEVSEGFTQMSGLAQSYDPALLERVRADPRHAEARIRVETRSLSRLLTESGHPHPDYLSLDIEGGELQVLRSFPFARHRVGIWSIENNTAAPEIAQIMRGAGYELIEFCGPDEMWRRGDL